MNLEIFVKVIEKNVAFNKNIPYDKQLS